MRVVRVLMIVLLMVASFAASGQQYTGLSGMMHVPTGEMGKEGEAHVGTHFLNRNMTPDTGFLYEGNKYHTFDYYLSVTPFSWLEMSYVCTERQHLCEDDVVRYQRKDRYLSFKIQPLKEGWAWPSLAVGCNDIATTIRESQYRSDVQLYFQNYYVTATKHFYLLAHEFSVTLAYRRFNRHYNAKWNGLVGGVAYRPGFFPQGRLMLEYTGNEVQIGADALLWNHLLIQASLKDFRYPNFGICYQTNLLGKKK